jgi:prolyl oligopeptidase
MRPNLQGVCFRMLLVCALVMLVTACVLAQNKDTAVSAAHDVSGIARPPAARVDPVVESLHGVQISDPYRWLENADSPETQQFVRDELAYTRTVLDRLPGRDQIHARLMQLLEIGTLGTPQIGGEYYFYQRREGTQNQPVLYVRRGLKGEERVLVDVNLLSTDGTAALDWWHAAHDGRYVAFGVSQSGNEMSTLHVIETATGRLLPDTIERTRGANVSWTPDGSGFYYGRYPKKGEVPPGQEWYNRRVFYHALGTDPAKDPLVYGEGLKPEYWPSARLSEDGRWLLINVSQGTGTVRVELFLKDLTAGAAPVRVSPDQDGIYHGRVFKGKIYIATNEGAPHYRMFVTDAAHPERANWRELIPEGDGVLQDFRVVGGKLLAEYEKDASSRLKVYALDGKLEREIQLPALGSVLELGGEWDSREAFYGFHSYTVPPTVFHYDIATGKSTQWAQVKAPIDPSAFEVKQLWFTSKDGTRVPMFVVARKGLALNRHSPTLLTGYGGFNIGRTPAFNRAVYLWLEHGGVFADANLRGGNEFGEDWHRNGMLGKKQNTFDDFISAAEYLISQKYTDKEHLAIQGGSNGGLLVGAALTQRPELFRAVVCQVPLLDMLRYQNFLIAKLWVSEYGSAENPEQFKWLYAYSPYHHVKEGTLYPATLLMTADSDSRVDPSHAKKMAALLQAKAANGPDRPILLRIEPKAGHGAGKPVSKLIEEATDAYSFLFWQLGVK